ncbi:MAG: inositol monophosphatase [Candidatus Sericytochromatia bacterium]|nr:inositol monophosphatase [Candidatus Sericytochromatia bacterium]
MQIVRDVACETALAAGEVLREGYGQIHEVTLKGATNNLVTEIDRRSEDLIMSRIGRVFPEHAFLGEETGAGGRQSPWRWIIDPLDGTTNYAHHYPCFCVSIGLAYEDEPVVGVVYQPLLNELFVAVKSQGATLNNRAIHVSGVDTLASGMLATGFPYNLQAFPDAPIAAFESFVRQAQAVRRDGSAAIDLAYVAAGRYDGFWESGLAAWDTAAGVLLVTEAGGRVSDYADAPYTLGGPTIAASNGGIHPAIIAVLQAASRRP